MKKLLSMIMAFVAIAFVASPVLAAPSVVYDALPSVDPDTSYPSQPFQAQQTFEFGDLVHLGGTDRVLNNVTVTMVTWAPFADYSSNVLYSGNNVSWTHPITLNVYSDSLGVNGVPDELLATVTQDITIPWRPAHDPSCPGAAWLTPSGDCFNGYAFNATFDLSSLNVVLPEDVIVSVAYNTQTYGLVPMVLDGPYNSLNVAVPENQPVSVGSDDSVNEVFWNTATAFWYADGGLSGVNIFRKDTNWTPYGTVALKIEAKPVLIAPPTTKDQCKKDGWMIFNNPFFKNQGDCVSFVQANDHANKK